MLSFGFPKSLLSDNGPTFTAKLTQHLSSVLRIHYHLHSCLETPILRKGWANQNALKNLGQTLPGNLGILDKIHAHSPLENENGPKKRPPTQPF